MGAEEEGTHEPLKAHRRELVDPKISEHSGCIVKTTGDGMLAEFPSVVDAVRCASPSRTNRAEPAAPAPMCMHESSGRLAFMARKLSSP
jgi:adenylate cyclase